MRFAGMVAALVLGLFAFQSAHAAERLIVITAFEPKGGTNVKKEPFPETLPPKESGVDIDEPDETGRWKVSTYVFMPNQIHVNEGDKVTLQFIGINGGSHPTTIAGYDKTFVLKRGQIHNVTFVADKPGVFPITCSTHHPTMTAELIVTAKPK